MEKYIIHQGDICLLKRINSNSSISHLVMLIRNEDNNKQEFSSISNPGIYPIPLSKVSQGDLEYARTYSTMEKEYYIESYLRASDVTKLIGSSIDDIYKKMKEIEDSKRKTIINDSILKKSKEYQRELVNSININLEIGSLYEKLNKIENNKSIILTDLNNLAREINDYNLVSELIEDKNKNRKYCLVYAKFPGTYKEYCWLRPNYLSKVIIKSGMRLIVPNSDDCPTVTRVEYSDNNPSNHKYFISIKL